MEKKFEGLKLWDEVSLTKKDHTKELNFGRKITAIDAYQQIKNFTEKFGPCGIGWGYHCEYINANPEACLVKLDLWIKGEGSFTEFGACEWKARNGKIDIDAPKKATTDALTKAFSRLGFNADVFLGLFEDNKYVAWAQEEIAKRDDSKDREAFDKKNEALIIKRLDSINTHEQLEEIMKNMELHFAPLYGLEVGKFFKMERFQKIVQMKTESIAESTGVE